MMQVIVMILGVFVVMGIQKYDAKSGRKFGGFMGIAILILAVIMILTSYKNLQPPKDNMGSETEISTEVNNDK